MYANYRTFTLTLEPDENAVDKILEILKEEGYERSPFELEFVGFYETPGFPLKINGNPLKVPRSGYFVTPMGDERFLRIKNLTFDGGCNALDIWCVY